MKDRNALVTRPMPQGLTPLQAYNAVAEKQGIPLHQVREGVIPAQKGIPQRGIQYDSPGPVPVTVPTCRVKTKAGADCKARPIGGQNICIGHSRQVKND